MNLWDRSLRSKRSHNGSIAAQSYEDNQTPPSPRPPKQMASLFHGSDWPRSVPPPGVRT